MLRLRKSKPPVSDETRIDREQLWVDVVRETGVQITPDDPILALIAVHDIVLDSYQKRWLKAVKRIERHANVMMTVSLVSMLTAFAFFSVLFWTAS